MMTQKREVWNLHFILEKKTTTTTINKQKKVGGTEQHHSLACTF